MINNEPNFEEKIEEGWNNISKRGEEKVQDIFKSLLTKIPVFIAFGIAIFYIFYGMVEVESVKLGVVERIGLTACTVALAVSYCSLIAEGGFTSAKQSKEWLMTYGDYEKAMSRGNTRRKGIMQYAKIEAYGNLYECRKNNLEANGIEYEKIFDDNGNLIFKNYESFKYHKTKNVDGFTRKQIKIIRKAINTRVIMPTIFGTISSKWFGLKKEQSISSYKTKTTTINTITRAVISICSVGFMFNFLGFNVGGFIYALFQIVLWSASGFSQRLNNYGFMINVIVPQMQEKTRIINEYMDLEEEEKNKYVESGVNDNNANNKETE